MESQSTVKENTDEFTLRKGSKVRALSDIEPKLLSFVWEPYLPKGGITFIAGEQGVGKTFACLAIASAVTTGGTLPNGYDTTRSATIEQGRVLYLTTENDPSTVLRPRFTSLGGNLKSLFFLDAEETLQLKQADVFEELIDEVKPALVIIDPIQAFIGASVDIYRANQVRQLMAPVDRLASKYDCAVLCCAHLRKPSGDGRRNGGDRPIHRVLGSTDFTAGARSMLFVRFDPEDESKRIIEHEKHNNSEKGLPLGFTLNEAQFAWHVIPAPTRPQHASSGIARAKLFLQEFLSKEPIAKATVMTEATKQGLSPAQLQRASHELGVRTKKGFGGEGYWSLPPADSANTAKIETIENAESPQGREDCGGSEDQGTTLVPNDPNDINISNLLNLINNPKTSCVGEDLQDMNEPNHRGLSAQVVTAETDEERRYIERCEAAADEYYAQCEDSADDDMEDWDDQLEEDWSDAEL